MFNEHIRSDFLPQEMGSDIPGPETPAMRPLFPRLKRIHEEPCHLECISDSPPLSSSKRIKSILDEEFGKGTHGNIVDLQGNRSKLVTTSTANHVDACCKHDFFSLSSQRRMKASGNLGIGKETSVEVSETVNSKFEWLNPSSIRDANGRRPNDPFYDKRTLYIPPNEMKKMSASQKQYWTVKCQYMDIVLFFKVVSSASYYTTHYHYLNAFVCIICSCAFSCINYHLAASCVTEGPVVKTLLF